MVGRLFVCGYLWVMMMAVDVQVVVVMTVIMQHLVVHNACGGVGSVMAIPGRTESFWKELDYVKNMWKHRQELKVEDAGIAALFGLECFAWFCAGEIVGRGFTFTGYYP
ncbi:hydrogen-transporting ATP synthase, rotational mechanism [Olea europaea subsp. europaea]|uniref:Hydrogen-transporting ATP synthase, rotational mechanism n=1 Tax=Olea europaea subsp. europaea TaxID=158383 RepID=A0A8S0UYL6_OLEEU|nr:hydrogen-transporting ATP synthase, rotational mechanism [Olea europaea subsp. europaea]